MKTTLLMMICGLGLAACDKAPEAPPPPNPQVGTSAQPDNTAVNARDRAPGAPTAGMQGQSKTDVQITADIRRRIMDAKLSVNAENVKVVSQNGKVTLRGPVNNQSEKDAIGRAASDAAGAANVTNELEVKPPG